MNSKTALTARQQEIFDYLQTHIKNMVIRRRFGKSARLWGLAPVLLFMHT